MIWKSIAIGCAGWSLGLMMGLSLGFRVGTRRTIILFQRHFPSTETLNKLVKVLLEAAQKK